MTSTTLESHAEIDAIVGGYHGDAFRILGPHAISVEGSKIGNWEIRAFLPQAEKAEVLTGGEAIPMEKRHPAGFFVAEMKQDPGVYEFCAYGYDGSKTIVGDPYRFPPLLTDFDLYLHGEGTNFESYHSMGAHIVECLGVTGVRFAVWAPNALVVSVVGDFNDWDTRRTPMRARSGGVWEVFVPGIGEGMPYKYWINSRVAGYKQMKADPYGFASEVPPKSASVVAKIETYQWQDQQWLDHRGKTDWLKEPMAIYEVHLESWMRKPNHESLSYRELAVTLVEYVKKLGYTHIELLPIMEYPFSGSWGYQVIGYYTPTARFGTPQDFMYFIDCCHQAGIGVIVDWVPAHFPKDAHGLAFFDGTALYEHADPRMGEHREWGTLVFNFGRNEVRTFLISNALFWLKQYHIDGLRVDAVASMLYLDYSRKAGEWIPNIHGGNENLEAISFLRKFNEVVHQVPGAISIAEESTAFPGVSRPVYLNGLGFTMKWNMGWMHDMLAYFEKDPIHRRYEHNHITFSLLYAFTENFVLPISHDEVVYGKRSLLNKMPGDEWQKFANVRAFLSYMYGHPGKKLLFMGSEIGKANEWSHDSSIPWQVLGNEYNRKLQFFITELNALYKREASLYEVDFHYSGFDWVDFHDADNSVVAFQRKATNPDNALIFCCNFTPVPRMKYHFGVNELGVYDEIFNSDSEVFGGSNMGNGGFVTAEEKPHHGKPNSISVTLPPLAVVVFKRRRG